MKMPKLNLSKQVKHLERLITDNSPMILTALGVVGVAGTAVLTHKATKQSEEVLAIKRAEINDNRAAGDTYVDSWTRAEVFSQTWKLYIVPVTAGVFTCAAIIGAQKINARRAAAIAGVLAMTQDNFKEYRDKVQEKLTGPQNKKVEAELAKEKIDRVFNKEAPIYVPEGQVLFVEAYTMRQFPSTKHKVLSAETELNRKVMREDAATLSDFYDILGLEHTSLSDKVGWPVKSPLEIEFTTTETPEGKPAFVINYVGEPIFRPWSANG